MYHLKRSLRSGCGCSEGCSSSSAIVVSICGCMDYCAPPSFVSNSCRALLKMKSTTKKKNPKMKTVIITTVVVACTSLREGATTLRISARTSLKKLVKPDHVVIAFPEIFASAPCSCTDFVAILPFLRVRHSCRTHPQLNLAGAEGFEPPSSVLE